MNKQKTIILLVALLCILLAGQVLAMESANYQLNWFTPLTSNGGGPASSTNYATNLTIGQSAIGASSGTNYDGCLGYWCSGAASGSGGHKIYLPLVLRNFS